MDLELHKGFHVRPGTMDDYVVNEISSYKTLEISSGDIVLDVGANIGSFAKTAAERGGSVVAIEPDPENFELLKLNTLGGPYCEAFELINEAVVGGDEDRVVLYKNRGKNKGLHSTVRTGKRDEIVVPARNWRRLLAAYQPTKIKIDCEGAEYDFLVPSELPGSVTGLIIEYNLSRRGEQAKGTEVHRAFVEHGWQVLKEPRFGTRAWATLASYRRN